MSRQNVSRRRYLQFSLGTFLFAVAIFCVMIVYARKQQVGPLRRGWPFHVVRPLVGTASDVEYLVHDWIVQQGYVKTS